MWNKAPLLSIYVSHRTQKKRFSLWIPVFLPVIHRLLKSYEEPLALLPGAAGRSARAAVTAAHGMVCGVMDTEPAEYLQLQQEHAQDKLRVSVRTIGVQRGKRDA